MVSGADARSGGHQRFSRSRPGSELDRQAAAVRAVSSSARLLERRAKPGTSGVLACTFMGLRGCEKRGLPHKGEASCNPAIFPMLVDH